MYKVLLNGTVFYDARIDDLAIINPVLNLEENSAGVFEFTLPPTHPRYEEIQTRSLFTVLRDDAVLWQGVAVEITTSFYKEKKVSCDGELTFLNESILRPQHFVGSVAEVFTQFINLHNAQVEEEKQFEVGQITVTGRALNCYSNMETPMQCIRDHCISTHNGVIRLRYEAGHRYIDYLQESDFRISNQPIKLGLNIKNYTSNLDNTEICSVVIPLGAVLEQTTVEGLETRLTIESVNSGKDYLVNDEAVQSIGYIYKTIEDDDITDPQKLKEYGLDFINSRQFDNVVITLSVVDLALVDDGVDSFSLSDQIYAISEPHGLNKLFRLTKQTLNLDAPERDTVTLGKEESRSLSAKTASVSGEIKNSVSEVTASQIAKNNASALLNGNGTGGYLAIMVNENGQPYEQLIMNTPSIETATRVWRYNQNGWGHGKRDSLTEDFTYTIAATMDGAFLADIITAGTLRGVTIIGESGTIGGWTINPDSISSSGAVLHSNGQIELKPSSAEFAELVSIWNNYTNEIRSSGILTKYKEDGDDVEGNRLISLWGGSGFISQMSVKGGRGQSKVEATSSAMTAQLNVQGYNNEQVLLIGESSEVQAKNWNQASDERLKKDIEDLDEKYIDKVLKLKPKKFKYKKGIDREYHGLIAQEVQKIGYNEIVLENSDGFLGINYIEIIPALILTIQKQQEQIKEIKEALNGKN